LLDQDARANRLHLHRQVLARWREAEEARLVREWVGRFESFRGENHSRMMAAKLALWRLKPTFVEDLAAPPEPPLSALADPLVEEPTASTVAETLLRDNERPPPALITTLLTALTLAPNAPSRSSRAGT
jgi:hypothetical protein